MHPGNLQRFITIVAIAVIRAARVFTIVVYLEDITRREKVRCSSVER